MVLLVLFDCPTKTAKDRKSNYIFRKALIKRGFTMLQYSVYFKDMRSSIDYGRLINLISQSVPKNGDVRFIRLNELQCRELNITQSDDNPDLIVI